MNFVDLCSEYAIAKPRDARLFPSPQGSPHNPENLCVNPTSTHDLIRVRRRRQEPRSGKLSRSSSWAAGIPSNLFSCITSFGSGSSDLIWPLPDGGLDCSLSESECYACRSDPPSIPISKSGPTSSSNMISRNCYNLSGWRIVTQLIKFG